MACVSLLLSLLIPRDPREGNETLLNRPIAPAAAPAE
jgi:hypothetical protein